jgi:hypothetical protein
MGMSMMPTMTAAMQAVPASAIARTSTAMNIIRQAGASIGTAVLTVILSSNITSRLHSIRGVPAGHGQTGFASLQHLPPSAHATVAGPLAHAFSSTFVWAIALLAVAFVPALAMGLLLRGKDFRRQTPEPTLAME